MARILLTERQRRFWVKARFWPPLSTADPRRAWVDALIDTGAMRSVIPLRIVAEFAAISIPFIEMPSVRIETATGDQRTTMRVLAEIELSDGSAVWRTSLVRSECSTGVLVLPKPYGIIGTDVLSLGRLHMSPPENAHWFEPT